MCAELTPPVRLGTWCRTARILYFSDSLLTTSLKSSLRPATCTISLTISASGMKDSSGNWTTVGAGGAGRWGKKGGTKLPLRVGSGVKPLLSTRAPGPNCFSLRNLSRKRIQSKSYLTTNNRTRARQRNSPRSFRRPAHAFGQKH